MEQSGTLLVLLAAGGTGGHLFPAEALQAALNRGGVKVALITDARAEKFGEHFPVEHVHTIPSATFRGRDPFSIAQTGATLAAGLAKAFFLFGRMRPAVVVGFGGYPTVPPILAAYLRKIPTVVHEQNGVMGRANKFLSTRVTAIATGFPGIGKSNPALADKVTFTGNPVRPAVLAAANTPYAQPSLDGPFHLLAFGGSQGARVMSDVVPAAIAKLEPHLQMRLRVTQQARAEDVERVQKIYARIPVKADVAPFFADLPARMAQSHLVIARSGASTVAELSAIGRPAILVPLPHALDQDQAANAAILEKAGGAMPLAQSDFTPDRLAAEIAILAGDPPRLTGMAHAAKTMGVLDAADQLADLVLKVAQTPL